MVDECGVPQHRMMHANWWKETCQRQPAVVRHLPPATYVTSFRPLPAAYGLLRTVLLAVALAAACGGSGSAPAPTQQTGTPAGTYTITVTGTSGGVDRTQNLTLTVN
jgi:hypothetical protein